MAAAENSVRADLEAAFKEHAEGAAAAEPTSTIKSPEGETAVAAAPSERVRDESGRFAPKEIKDGHGRAVSGEAQSPADKKADSANSKKASPGDGSSAGKEDAASGNASAGVTVQSAQPREQSARQSAEVTAAPQGWSLGAKAKWAELPPDIRAEISKRETDMHRFATKDDDERKFARSMYQAVSPYEAAFRSEGVSAPQYVANVLNVAYTLRTADPFTKAQTLATLAQQFGVDLKLLAPTTDGQSQNPELAALKQQYAELHNERQREKQERERAAQEARQREEQEVQQAISAFASDPAHKYIQAVAPVMGALLQSGQAQTMKEAYEMAVYARPDIRAQLQAEEKAKQDAERLSAQKAEEARRKGKSVRGGPGGSMPAAPNPNASVREDLEAAFAEARGRI